MKKITFGFALGLAAFGLAGTAQAHTRPQISAKIAYGKIKGDKGLKRAIKVANDRARKGLENAIERKRNASNGC